MPRIRPINGWTFARGEEQVDISSLIAPPYDVLDQAGKDALLKEDAGNIVAVDLPHLPPKTVGPDATYQQAGELFRKLIADGVLEALDQPAMFAYRQTYTVGDKTFKRLGLIADVYAGKFGENVDGQGAILPHEQTFSAPKEDRLKLMHATEAQLSPIFGMYSDVEQDVNHLLETVVASDPKFTGTTANDQVLHELWLIDNPAQVQRFEAAFSGMDVFIADGHHRYTTSLNYRESLGDLPEDHPAAYCMFVLVAIQDPGMIVLPTHRVLGGMRALTLETFAKAIKGRFELEIFAGGEIEALEAALVEAGPHAMGVYIPGEPMAIMRPTQDDPLAASHGSQSQAWRQLDVAILQHLLVEQICQPQLCPEGGEVAWKFPHSLDELKAITDGKDYQLGLVVQPTPLESVRLVSQAGELMPQKSTFFYPKLATGLVLADRGKTG